MEIFITGGTGNIGQYVTLSTAFLLEAAEKKGRKIHDVVHEFDK